jgi:hypothetical protein
MLSSRSPIARLVHVTRLRKPQHQISRRHFEVWAKEAENEFVPLYKAFVVACTAARDAAVAFRAVPSPNDVELVLSSTVDGDVYSQTEVAGHILRTSFGPTPSGFIDGLGVLHDAIQADIYDFGDDGFIGHVYSPAATEERACPWCAETIKAAAIVCRFCNREVAPPRNTLPNPGQ